MSWKDAPIVEEEWESAPIVESPSGFAQGLADPIYGASQLLENAMPESITQPVNQFNDYLIDEWGAPLQRMGDGGVDAQVQQREADYQAARQAAGDTGSDWGRIGGNVVSGAIPGVGVVGKAAGLGTKLMVGTAGGAIGGASMPVTEGDFTKEKLKQALVGSIGGSIGTSITSGIGRMLAPQTNAAIKALRDENVPVTVGQALGGFPKKMEESARSIPLIGDSISAAHRRGVEGLNRATANRALAPIMGELPDNVKVGHEAVEYVSNQLSDAYDAVLPHMRGQLDDTLLDDIGGLTEMAGTFPKAKQEQFARIIDEEVIGKFTDYGKASGETIKSIESSLGRIAKDYMKDQDYDVRKVGEAVKETQAALRAMITRHNPQHAEVLQRINDGYSQYKVFENAAGRVGADEGMFTPAQLKAAVRFKDYTKDKAGFAKGQALLEDLADAGKSGIAQTVPDSGTPGRLMMAAGGGGAIGGSAMIDPTIATGVLSAMAGSTKIPQKLMVGAMTDRPEWLRNLGGLLGDYSGSIGFGGGAGAQNY